MFTHTSSRALSRRDLLKRTLYFSSGALLPNALKAAEPVASPSESLHFLAFGDFGSKNAKQFKVAQTMNAYARQLKSPLEAVLALGDNFYGKMTPDRFKNHFEDLYEKEAIPCPFYACLGNHDYEYATYGLNPEPRKSEVQLAYARENPESRWKMPAKWFSKEFSFKGQPLLRLISLDSNMREGDLTPQEKLAQKRWVEAELARGTQAPWTILMWHHPLYTESTKRKDSGSLQRLLGDVITQSKAALVISGHDHNLQHLRIDGIDTNFVVSGGGGAGEYEVSQEPRGFANPILGFNHIEINEKRMKVTFLNSEGKVVHAFRQFADGRMTVAKI